jgi:hypothetical protein
LPTFFSASCSTAGRDRQPETRNPQSVMNLLVSVAAVG